MRQRISEFMQGRYGMDAFGKFTCAISMVLACIDFFMESKKFSVLSSVTMVLILYSYFRMFSKNYAKRSMENQKYLQATEKIRSFLSSKKKRREDRKLHCIFKCPKCKQKIRVPKGKGKIMIHCPKCQKDFIRHT